MSSFHSDSKVGLDSLSDKKSDSDGDVSSIANSYIGSQKSNNNNNNNNNNNKKVYSKKSNVQQLLARLAQEIDEREPSNVIHFIVDFLCKHYPEHLHGFEVIWNGDPDLEQDRLLVVEFFKTQKLPVEISAHFINAGFDTLETLCTLSTNSLDDVEKFNSIRWLPGHKVRLQQTFNDITNRVRLFKDERDTLIKSLRTGLVLPQTNINTPIVLPNQPSVPLPINYSIKRPSHFQIGESVPAHFYKR